MEMLEARNLLAFSITDAVLVQPSTTPRTLIQYESRWNYLANGSDPGSEWSEPNFDDAGWTQAGRQPLGYGAENAFELNTRVSCGPTNPSCTANNFATTYFRHAFFISDPESFLALTAGMSRTDATAVYLNGVEIYRDSLLSSNAAFDEFASGTLAEPSLGFTIDPNLLSAGRNVISAEVHAQSAEDGKLSFDLQLTGLVPVSSAGQPELELQLSDPVDPSSVETSDLELVDLQPLEVMVASPTSLRFLLPESALGRTLDFAVAAGALAAMDGTRLEGFHDLIETDLVPQYLVKHTPRLQPGNMPLVPYAGSENDQVDILWQTLPAGSGVDDQFTVEYRETMDQGMWRTASQMEPLDTGVDGRLIHAAHLRGLDYDTDYEYRLRHRRGQLIVNEYVHTFRTRLPASSDQPFRFVAYGDSARQSTLPGFRAMHAQLNKTEGAAFALLLGDNVYPFGRHQESDARFDPWLSPEATQWAASHIDYATIGNHESAVNVQPFREYFANPIQESGVNAPAQPPDSEPPEHNYSFDYGNVHFTTFDSTSLDDAERLEGLISWVEADVAASDAQWKIVFPHHPVAFVPDKGERPSDNYYRQVIPRLKAAGVDIFLVGHSHTYSRTRPLLGEVDGVATFVEDDDDVYQKGAGLVQVVAGASGRSLRPGSYTSPGQEAVAVGFTTETDPPIAYGFAQIDVTNTQLTIQFVTEPDGVVLDTFSIVDSSRVGSISGQFFSLVPNPRITPVHEIPLSFDAPVTGVDLADLTLTRDAGANLLNTSVSLQNLGGNSYLISGLGPLINLPGQYEIRLNSANSGIQGEDGGTLAGDVFATWRDVRQAGDANLDGQVDSDDIVSVLATAKYLSGRAANWAEGDWNGDGFFNQLDLVEALRVGRYLQGPYF